VRLQAKLCLALSGLLALLAVLACERPPSPGSAAAFRVALVTPGPISDAGWNASAYDGLMQIRDQLGAQVSHMQASTPSDFEEAFRDYARQGYDLVIGHGFEFQDAAVKVGGEFPKTVFVTSSGNVHATNVASFTFHLDQATYLAGIMAGMMSKTGRAGCVGGIELPVIRTTFDGFVAGAKSVRPDFVVAITYTGSFEDVTAAKAATDAIIAQGADFVLHNANAAGLGVFQSAKEKGVLAFGSNRDQNDVAPETVLASAVLSIPKAFLGVAQEVKEHRFIGRAIQYGLKDGVVGLVVNPLLADRIPADVMQRVTSADAQIRAGSLVVAMQNTAGSSAR
jgi:basic membrane lipoprotein Med (substrate-binding protein (PBP1-ABC) superfamily)